MILYFALLSTFSVGKRSSFSVERLCILHWVGGQIQEVTPQSKGRSTKPDGVQQASGQCSQTSDLISEWSSVESAVGFSDPRGVPSNLQYSIIQLYESMILFSLKQSSPLQC